MNQENSKKQKPINEEEFIENSGYIAKSGPFMMRRKYQRMLNKKLNEKKVD